MRQRLQKKLYDGQFFIRNCSIAQEMEYLIVVFKLCYYYNLYKRQMQGQSKQTKDQTFEDNYDQYPDLEPEKSENWKTQTQNQQYSDEQIQQNKALYDEGAGYQYYEQTSSHEEYIQPAYYEAQVNGANWGHTGFPTAPSPHYWNPNSNFQPCNYAWNPYTQNYVQNQGFLPYPHENPQYHYPVMQPPVMSGRGSGCHGWKDRKWQGHKMRGRGGFCHQKFKKHQGWHQKSSSSSSESKSKNKRQKQHHKHAYKAKNQEYKSSCDQDLAEIQQQIQGLNLEDRQQNKQELYTCMKPYFDKYNAMLQSQFWTMKFLAKKFKNVNQLDPLIASLLTVEVQCPEIFIVLPFHAIVKTIINLQYNFILIQEKLKKKQKIKIKKYNNNKEFAQRFPEPTELEFLQVQDLLKLDTAKTLFLIDGNNVMQRQKHFRSYFEGKTDKSKAEGQIRLAWLVQETGIKAQLFFDNKYEEQIYDKIKKYLFSQENINKVPVYYADKDKDPKRTADQQIVSRLTQIVSNKQYQNHEIVLVSADRALGQLCSEIFPIKKSSGIYIFKYCKKLIKNRRGDSKDTKFLLKDIFRY